MVAKVLGSSEIFDSARPECFAAHEVRTSKMYRRIRAKNNRKNKTSGLDEKN